MKTFDLVPENKLILRDFDDDTQGSVVVKFVRCFRSVWQQIPPIGRNTLLDYWKPKERPVPHIDINDFTLPMWQIGSCGYGGYKLTFDCRVPSKRLRGVIAHELGHALSWAHGWFEQHVCDVLKNWKRECVACECRTFSYMAAWGFDPFDGRLPKVKGDGLLLNRIAKK